MFKSQGKKLNLDILFEKIYTSFPHRELSFDSSNRHLKRKILFVLLRKILKFCFKMFSYKCTEQALKSSEALGR